MSYRTIAVGVDLSPESERAAMQALSLARHCGARLILVNVGVVPDHAVGIPASMREMEKTYVQILDGRLAEDRARLEALRQRLLGQGAEVSHVVIDGAADTALADTAKELGADLIAVGTHGRTGIKRFLLGSVAERTVRVASSSVLVARGAAATAEGGYHRIVVGTDYSPFADAAIARALDVAAAGAHVHILHAWQVPVAIAPESLVGIAELRDGLAADARQRSEDLRRAWRARAGEARVELQLESSEAPAQQALIERAEAIGADLIVVGSHGRRGIRRFALGSVAEVTVRHAPCSVLVARP